MLPSEEARQNLFIRPGANMRGGDTRNKNGEKKKIRPDGAYSSSGPRHRHAALSSRNLIMNAVETVLFSTRPTAKKLLPLSSSPSLSLPLSPSSPSFGARATSDFLKRIRGAINTRIPTPKAKTYSGKKSVERVSFFLSLCFSALTSPSLLIPVGIERGCEDR